jgi:protein SSD1
MDTGTISTADVDALFDDDDDDDDDDSNDLNSTMAGVSLNPDRPTQSMPPSPTRRELSGRQAPHRVNSDSKLIQSASEAPEAKLTNKEKYLSWFALREENGDYIQDVKEMMRVPVILKTDLTKSPP